MIAARFKHVLFPHINEWSNEPVLCKEMITDSDNFVVFIIIMNLIGAALLATTTFKIYKRTNLGDDIDYVEFKAEKERFVALHI